MAKMTQTSALLSQRPREKPNVAPSLKLAGSHDASARSKQKEPPVFHLSVYFPSILRWAWGTDGKCGQALILKKLARRSGKLEKEELTGKSQLWVWLGLGQR